MKAIISLVMVLALLAGCGNMSQKAEKPEKAPEELAEIRLDVQGMTCTGCENSVIRALGNLEGVYDTEASFEDELVVVYFDAEVIDIEQIAEAIKRVGYSVAGEKPSEEGL